MLVDIPKGENRVGAYGTLKQKRGNNILLRESNAKFLGYECVTLPYTMIDYGYFPALVPSDKEEKIYLEVWSGDEEMLAACDMLEGHPDWYLRIKVRRESCEALDTRFWVYTMPDEDSNDYDSVVDNIWNPTHDELLHWIQKGHEFSEHTNVEAFG